MLDEMSYIEPPAGPWASTTVPFPADSFPFTKPGEFVAPFSWSSWVPGYSNAVVQTISFRTRKLNSKPAIVAWQMWTTDDRFNGVGIRGYQECEEHVLHLYRGEKITSCTVWMNIVQIREHKACVGRVRLVTDRGQVLDTAPNDNSLGTGLSRPVGNGLLCGALGKQALYATKTLCLLFLTKEPTFTQQFESMMQPLVRKKSSITWKLPSDTNKRAAAIRQLITAKSPPAKKTSVIVQQPIVTKPIDRSFNLDLIYT